MNDHVTYQLKFYLPTSHLTNNGGDPFSENTPFLYQSFLWSEFLSSSPDVHFCYLSCTLAMECLSHRYHQTTTQPLGHQQLEGKPPVSLHFKQGAMSGYKNVLPDDCFQNSLIATPRPPPPPPGLQTY